MLRRTLAAGHRIAPKSPVFPLPVMPRRCLLLLFLALLAIPAPSAFAQGDGLVPKALYKTGNSGRWLMGGQWFFRADPSGNGKQPFVARPEQGICGQSARREQVSIDIANARSDQLVTIDKAKDFARVGNHCPRQPM